MRVRHQRRQQQRFCALVEMLEERRLLTTPPIVVNTPQDADFTKSGTNKISLRDAINTANKSATPTTITFDTTGWNTTTILLTHGVLELSNTKQAVTITGPAADVTINGNQNSGIFEVDKNVHVSLSSMTITGGIGVDIRGNGIHGGGGIHNNGGTMTLTNVAVSGNTPKDYAGGIYNGGTMTLTNVIVSGNSSGFGAGIDNDGMMSLLNVTVSDNKGQDYGGGIENDGTMTLTNVTVTGNSTGIWGGGIGSEFLGGTETMTNVTIVGNTAGTGGGIATTGPTTLVNCIIAGNSGKTPDADILFGSLTSFGNNLVGITDLKNVWGSTDLTGTSAHPLDPKLGLLANNGGPAQTMLPLLGSPALNGGSNAFALDPTDPNHKKLLTTDQRGQPRIQDGTVDIGAVEEPIGNVSAEISGQVLSDINGNGKKDGKDAPVAGVRVFIDTANTGVYDPKQDVSALTDKDGNYILYNFLGGVIVPHKGYVGPTFKVEVALPAGYTRVQTPTGASYSVNLVQKASASGQNFGIVPIATNGNTGFLFKGTVFFDANKNGTQQTGEAGLTGWKIYADINHDNKFDTGDVSTFTTTGGAYTLGLTGSGTYMLHEIVPANWTQTHPTSNAGISITLNAASTKTGLNFGDFTSVKYLKTVATTSGIVGWWTFDSASQANSILNGYTGTLKGSAKISAAGKGAPITGEQNNTALVLNGTSAFVDTNLTTQQQFATAGTYNVWVNLGSTPAKSGHFYTIAAKSVFGNDLDLFVQTDGSVHFYTDNGTSTSFKPASLTGWHMVTAEFDSAAKTRKLFWDGKLVATTAPYTGTHSANTGTFSIGESDVFTGRFFNGSIDEVSLWNRALTATEITAIHNAATT